jgi:hypothetical protein
MTPKTLKRNDSKTPLVMKILKLMYSLKNTLGVYLISTFEQKAVFLAIFKPESAGKLPVFRKLGAYLPPNSLYYHHLPRPSPHQ